MDNQGLEGVARAGLEKRGQILSRQLVSVTVSLTVCFHYSVKSVLSAVGNATMPLLWGLSNLWKCMALITMFKLCLRFIIIFLRYNESMQSAFTFAHDFFNDK